MAHKRTVRRSSIRLKPGAALTITRFALDHDRLVYVFVTDRSLKYAHGQSHIAYIGTTKKGTERISQSVSTRAEAILRLHGVRSFQAKVLTCRRRRRVKMWFKLERALIVAFRNRFGEIPRCNVKGNKMTEKDVFRLFRRERVDAVIRNLSQKS